MLIDLLTTLLSDVLTDIFGTDMKQMRDRRAVQRALTEAIKRAETRFCHEYQSQDAELVDILTMQTRFADVPSVKAAVRDLLAQPFRDPSVQVRSVQQSFLDVVPDYTDRRRVDAAVSAFLSILGQEVLLIPQIQQTYSLVMQRRSAENSQHIAAHTAALLESIQDLRTDVQHLPTARAPALPDLFAYPAERPRPWHNLPRRSYSQFIGRHDELQQLAKWMLPYPRSRHFAVTLDGIGGVGKSALALEFAHQHRDHYAALPPDERFEAIVWVTAKRTMLTASGIQQRQQTFSTLSDLYREIATVLAIPALLQVDREQQRGLIERAVSSQRTVLIIDNLETIDDDELLTFIRELPDPTKVIVTTRHRLDIAIPIRVLGMPAVDAYSLMAAEAASKQVALTTVDMDHLFRRTAGVPLALVWSIALMSLGHGVESVLRRLGRSDSDIAQFCFAESIEHIRSHDAYRLLLALSLFDDSVNRIMLGEVAGLGDDDIGRDDGLVELEQLSLVNKVGDRFSMLPLTRTFALGEVSSQPALEQDLRDQWVRHLIAWSHEYARAEWRWRDLAWLQREGMHFVTLMDWAHQTARPDIFVQVFPGVLSYYEGIGHWDRVLDVAHMGLDTARLLNDTESMVYALNVMAWISSQQGRHDEAERIVRDGLNLARTGMDSAWELDLLQTSSQIVRRAGRIDEALTWCEQALSQVHRLPASQQAFVRANIQYEIGKIARDRGDWHKAHTYFVAARSVFKEDDDTPTFNLTRAWGLLSNLGLVAHRLGNLDEAAQMCDKALRFFVTHGSIGDATTIRVRLAAIEADRGQHERALRYANDALAWSTHLGMVQEQAQAEAIRARLAPGDSDDRSGEEDRSV